MWTAHHILLDSGLWGKGKLHAKKFYAAHRYSREDNFVMLFKLWLADNKIISTAFKQMSAAPKYSYGQVRQWFCYR